MRATFDRHLDTVALSLVFMVAVLLTAIVPVPFFRWAMAGSALLTVRARRRRELYALAAALPIAVILTGIGNGLLVKLLPHTIDGYLLATDFGVSAAVYRWTHEHQAAHALLSLAYAALPAWAALVLSYTEDAIAAGKRLVIAALAAVPFFILFPAVGPVWVNTPDALRNCLPSLHMTWALMLWWYSPRALRHASVVFALLTAAATLGLGEHYVIDLVAAVPFTVAVLFRQGRRSLQH